MGKQIVLYLFNKILFNNKWEQTIDIHKNMKESQIHMLSERSLTQNNRCCVIPFIWSSKIGKMIPEKLRTVAACERQGEEGAFWGWHHWHSVTEQFWITQGCELVKTAGMLVHLRTSCLLPQSNRCTWRIMASTYLGRSCSCDRHFPCWRNFPQRDLWLLGSV